MNFKISTEIANAIRLGTNTTAVFARDHRLGCGSRPDLLTFRHTEHGWQVHIRQYYGTDRPGKTFIWDVSTLAPLPDTGQTPTSREVDIWLSMFAAKYPDIEILDHIIGVPITLVYTDKGNSPVC